jgi:hypothetical protein
VARGLRDRLLWAILHGPKFLRRPLIYLLTYSAYSSTVPHMAGTMLELATRTGGDEVAMIQALRTGYTLTGNFKGREGELLLQLAAAADAEED